jgi:hypothetical protein
MRVVSVTLNSSHHNLDTENVHRHQIRSCLHDISCVDIVARHALSQLDVAPQAGRCSGHLIHCLE